MWKELIGYSWDAVKLRKKEHDDIYGAVFRLDDFDNLLAVVYYRAGMYDSLEKELEDSEEFRMRKEKRRAFTIGSVKCSLTTQNMTKQLSIMKRR